MVTVPTVPKPNEVYDSTELFQAFCRLANCFGLFLILDDKSSHSLEELKRACPLLPTGDAWKLLELDRGIYLFYDSVEKMESAYDYVVGDDGPTKVNSYDGPVRILAVTCNSDGNLQNENS